MAQNHDKITGPEGLPVAPFSLPDERQCALLLLMLIKQKEVAFEKEISRFRVAETSLRRLWWRQRLSPSFIEAVADWLLYAGWSLFYTGSAYAVIRADVTSGWMRLSSKSLQSDLEAVALGKFDFASLEHLLAPRDRLVGSED